ncbi:MAG: tetratricopeptide repeat protein [Telluria sp.]
MAKYRLAHLGFVMAALGFTAAPALLGLNSAVAAETMRPEVGKPIQEAQALMKAGKNKEALAKLREADAVSGKNANETYVIERIRASAAMGAGDYDLAGKTFEQLLASGKLSAKERDNFSEGLVGIYMRAGDLNKANAAILRQLKEGDNPTLREYLLQNYYKMGRMEDAKRELQSSLAAAQKAGRAPSEGQLGMMANIQLKANDKAGYVRTIEQLAQYYPKANYWNDLLNRVTGKPGFSSRLLVDVDRLKLMNGLMKKPSEFMEMGQLALQAKAPAEAQKVTALGYKSGVLGVGAEAARHQRLKDLADKEAAAQLAGADKQEASFLKEKDYDGLADLGYGLVQAGKSEQGLKMMEAAVKAGTKYPDEAKLHLGEAYAIAGNKAKAQQVLRSVGGTDGSADLARYYIMAMNHPAG